MRVPNAPPKFGKPQRRRGCLGCLGQCSLALLLGVVVLVASTAVFYPWAFYLGGKFHIVPMWQGWGRVHSKAGEYLVWIQFEPTPRGSGMYLQSNLTGLSYVCTPRGERIRMHLGGGMPKHLHLSTDGEPISFSTNYYPAGYGGFIGDRRPHLEFRGRWKNPDIVMDDHGSFAKAFDADGSVYRGHDAHRLYSTQGIPITFSAGRRSEFDKACEAIRR